MKLSGNSLSFFQRSFLCVILSSLPLSCQKGGSEDGELLKIIGGDNRYPPKKQYSFVGALSLRGQPGHCTAFAMAPFQVMTAAHCLLSGTHPDLYEFRTSLGTYQILDAVKFPDSDLAILRVDSPTPFEGFLPLSEGLSTPGSQEKAFIVSYDPGSDGLLKSRVGDLTWLSENGKPSGVFTHRFDTSQGASGAPLIMNQEIAGVHLGSLMTREANYGVMPSFRERVKISAHLTGINTEFSVFDDLLFGGAILLSRSLSYGAEGVGKFVSDTFKPMIIRRVLHSYLKGMDLPEDSRKSLYDHIEAPVMTKQVVPFLMTLSQIFQTSDASSQKGFDEYAREKFQEHDYPGLDHSLFRWQKAQASPKGLALSPDKALISKILLVYDVLFLQNSKFKTGEKTEVDQDLLDLAVPVVRTVIEELSRMDGGDHALKDIVAGLLPLLSDAHKLEAVTSTLAGFVYLNFYKFWHLIGGKRERVRERLEGFEEALKRAPDDLIDQLLKEVNHQKFSVHILVDGLQGHLMEALAKGQSTHPFIQGIWRDDQNQVSFRPQLVPSREAPGQQHQFLYHIAANDFEIAGYLPFFRRLYENGDAHIPEQGVSTTPTISVRNLPVAQTGAPVTGEGSTNLPNFHFVDREEDRAWYFYGNDSLYLAEITKNHGMKTLPERLPHLNSLNCFGSYDAGFKVLLDPLLNLALGESIRDYGEKLCLGELERRASNQKLLLKKTQELSGLREVLKEAPHWYDFLFPARAIQRENARYLIADIARLKEDSLPEYLHYYNPWPDHFAHFAGPFSDEIISPTGELNRLDYWLGKISATYEKAGVLPRTLFGMSGDHGLAPNFYITFPVQTLLTQLEEKGIFLVSEKISSDEGEGPRISHPTKSLSMKGKDLIYASTAGGNLMMDFFKDQDQSWTEQPLYRHLTDLTTLSGQKVNMIEAILDAAGDSLDYLVVREIKPSGDESVTRLLRRDEFQQTISDLIYRRENRYFYEGPHDLLRVRTISPYRLNRNLAEREELLSRCLLNADFSDDSGWCSREEWARLTRFSERPDSLVQVAHLYDSDLAGTVNLFPGDGVGYNTVVPGRHAGEHFHEKDAFVGFWSQDPDLRFKEDPSVVIGSVPATLYQYLSPRVSPQPPMAFPGLLLAP